MSEEIILEVKIVIYKVLSFVLLTYLIIAIKS